MCTMSMVYDHFDKRFPDTSGWPSTGIGPLNPAPSLVWPPPQTNLAELRQLIADFKQAIEAARTLDALMQQKDCVDPEKAALKEKVDRMEKIIDALLAKQPAP